MDDVGGSPYPERAMTDDFTAAARRIHANPLGRLMHGQRELFHSNLIAWYFDALQGAADATFQPLTHPGTGQPRKVERERGHLDLVFHWPEHASLVIENKVFSLPQRAQLAEYRSATATWQPEPALVLLFASTPDFDLGDWRHVSYGELAERILDALPSTSSYEVETMRHYAALASDLHQLVSAVDVRSDDEPVWLSATMLSSIDSSQMRAALQKARAQRVARLLNEHIPGLDPPAKGDLSNSTPLVEILEDAKIGGRDVRLGWQFQGDQFRRAVVYRGRGIEGRTAESKQRREELSRAHPELFTFPGDLPQHHHGRKEFNHFAPAFVYQYVKASTLTIGGLIEAAQAVHAQITGLRH